MQVVWEAADIRAGRRVRKPGCNETWMIGYDHGVERPEAKYAVISLIDGMISRKGMTAAEAADFLNKTGDHPVELLPSA